MPTRRLSLPFTFSEVLAEEYALLKGLEPPSRADPTFVEQDFPDPPALIAELRDEKTGLSRSILERYGAQLEPRTLAVVFNELTGDPNFYTPERFAQVELDSHAREAVRLLPALAPDDRARVHRILLEQAYGTLIRKLEDRRRADAYRRIHTDGLTALCLSGGGIRSATFGLGVLQGLAHKGVLNVFSYLSTVSGGGYIGSWLSAWAYRHPRGLAGVMAALGHPSRSPTSPEPPAVHHLRAYSNYLTPHLGVLSADTWALIGTYLRNLILNWVILVPLLLVAILLSPLLLAWLSAPLTAGVLTLAAGLLSGAVGLTYLHLFRPSLSRYRTRWRAAEGQDSFLLLALVPMTLSALLLSMYGWHHLDDLAALAFLPRLAASTAVFNLVTWAISVGMLRRPTTLREAATMALSGAFGGGVLWYVLWSAPRAVAPSSYVAFAVPAFFGIFLLAATIFIGLASRWTDDEDREWWARAGAWMLMTGLVWLGATVLTFFGPSWYLDLQRRLPGVLEGMGGIAGLLTLLLGYSKRTSGPTGPLAQPEWKDRAGGLILTVATPLFVVFLVVVLAIGVQHLLGVSSTWRLSSETSGEGDGYLGAGKILIAIVSAILLAAFSSNYININKFSLHGLYRNRLIRAYLGASRGQRTPNPFTGFDSLDNLPMTYLNPAFLWPQDILDIESLMSGLEAAVVGTAQADLRAFRERLSRARVTDRLPIRRRLAPRIEARVIQTVNDLIAGPLLAIAQEGGDPRLIISDAESGEDGLTQSVSNRLTIERLCPGAVRPLTALRLPGCLHVINTTLNLVKGEELAWQQRKAESMTISPLHAGNHRLGYRSVKQYAKQNGYDPLTLGTAMAISGAAASPNMGYHSSPVVTLLMTLFNVRLGWWLGNPGPAGAETYSHASPRWALMPLLEEAFGLTDDAKPYVYLSDGGHFENLGLYEMVLRRCRVIVVCDAGHDPECHFEDLGNAIRKIRIDLGITITIDQYTSIMPRSRKETGKYCAKGKIAYSDIDPDAPDGVLIYIKPAFSGDESADIYNYAMEHQDFPHEPTSNQWFNESQFESYRMLGRHIIDEISPSDVGAAADPLHAFVTDVDNYLKK